jgi:hypothetical protein
VFFILTMSPTAEPVAPNAGGGGTRYTVRRTTLRKPSRTPVDPEKGVPTPEPKLLPEVTATTEQQATTLIADSNPNFPLTRPNAVRALRGPPGATSRVAGPGGEGADVVFEQATESGVVRVRREIKCIQGGAQGTFSSTSAATSRSPTRTGSS